MHDLLAASKFYLAMQCAALAAMPLCFILFRRLSDRGWAIAKIIGPLLMVYLCWLGAHGWWSYSSVTLALCLGAVAAVGLVMLFTFRKRQFAVFLRRRFSLLLTIELIFLIGFAAGCLTRMIAPEATFEINRSAAEKFFDFTLLQNLYLTENFPAEDTWLAGYTLNYYYFGHLIFASVGRLANVAVGYTFNLALAAVVGLLAVLSFSLAHQFTRSLVWSALAALMVCIAGNLDAVRQFFVMLSSDGSQLFRDGQLFRDFDFWASSRVIPDEMITEFPAFSFLLGDPHAHVLALPLVLAALLTIVALGRGVCVLRRDSAAVTLKLLPLWLLFALILGALSAANLWDYYTLSGIAVVVLGGLLLRDVRRNPGALMGGMVMCLLMILVGRLILFFHFQDSFIAPISSQFKLSGALPPRWGIVSPVKIVPTDLRSPLGPFLMQWGLLLAPLALFFTPGSLRRLFGCRLDKRIFFIALMFLFFVGGFNLGANMATPILLLLMLAIVFHRHWSWARPQEMIMRLLLLAAAAILIGAELIYVDDIFSGINERINTLFKMTYPMWVLLSCGAIWCWARMIRDWRGRGISALAGAGCFLMVALGLFYPVLGLGSRVQEKERYPGRAGVLDCLRYLEQDPVYGDDFRLALWMKKNLPREVTILEAGGESYSAHGRMAAWSGIPSVLGWAGHEWGWRGSTASDDIYRRLNLIDQFYLDPNPELAAELQADYLVLGALEHQRFGELAPLFNRHFSIVQQFGATRLYRVE
jgi:YYY domain-containing protein